MEISDASLDFDKNVKTPLFAAAGIPEYWIADLSHNCVLVHSGLDSGTYRSIRQFLRGDTLTPQLLPG